MTKICTKDVEIRTMEEFRTKDITIIELQKDLLKIYQPS